MRNFFRQARVLVKVRKPTTVNEYLHEFQIDNLRISFALTKSIAWASNAGTIKVWNLSQDVRNIIKDYGDEIVLSAGYRDNGGMQILFIGQTTMVSHDYAMPEIVTTFECGDGDKYLNQTKGVLSYAEGTPAQTIIRDIAAFMELPIGDLNFGPNLVYNTGFQFSGTMKEALAKACAFLKLQAHVENGALYVTSLSETDGQVAKRIDQSTGMIGVPERYVYRKVFEYKSQFAPTSGYKVNVALRPDIIPGNAILLSSTHLQIQNELHRVETIRHIGDTFGTEWSSNLELTKVIR